MTVGDASAGRAGKPTRLVLIRHGESTPQVERVIGGMHGDRGLTPLGREQCRRLGDRLAATGEIAADVLIASTLPRARQTAEIIAPVLHADILWDDDVQELRPGDADGRSAEEADALFGVSDFERYPFRPVAPGGESWPQFVIRASTALDRITRQHAGKSIVVVCHGGIVDSSFLWFFHMPTLTLPPVHFATRNTSITEWERLPDAPRQRAWRIVRYNDSAHLEEIGDGGTQKAGALAGADRPAVPVPSERPKQ